MKTLKWEAFMPDEKVVEEVVSEETEAPVEGLPEGDSPFKSADATVEDESTEEGSDETSEEAEDIVDTIDPDLKASKESEAKVDEADEVLKKPETNDEKSNVQKRIDKLTAEIKSLREENEKVKNSKPEEKVKEKTKFTYEQLAYGLEKAISDGDGALARDVFFQGLKQVKEEVKNELVEMYEGEKKANVDQTSKIQREWNETILAFDRYSNEKAPEIWPGSRTDLKLEDSSSLLYKVAMKLYMDPEKGEYYRNTPGGQKLAVTDALTYVISYKGGTKVKDSEKERMKRQLQKEKRKKSLGSGSPGSEERSSRPISNADALKDYLDERKSFQNERGV